MTLNKNIMKIGPEFVLNNKNVTESVVRKVKHDTFFTFCYISIPCGAWFPQYTLLTDFSYFIRWFDHYFMLMVAIRSVRTGKKICP